MPVNVLRDQWLMGIDNSPRIFSDFSDRGGLEYGQHDVEIGP
jgi:hypothetical protein